MIIISFVNWTRKGQLVLISLPSTNGHSFLCPFLPEIGNVQKRIPAELLFEICHSLPFRLRWATDRVALAFDHLVLKIQCVSMKAEFARQIKIAQKKHLLTFAKRELSKVTKKLFDRNLSTIFDGIAFEFRVDFHFGVAEMDLRGMTSLEIFNKKLERVLAERVDYDDPNAIESTARFLVCQINHGLILLSHRTDFPMEVKRIFYNFHLFYIFHIQFTEDAHGMLIKSI